MFREAMIDLETMSARSYAALASVGVYLFNVDEDPASLPDPRVTLDPKRMFYRLIDIGSCARRGLSIDAETVYWWMQRSEQARRALTAGGKIALDQALSELTTFMGTGKRAWGHGAGFDPVILGNAYEVCGQKAPWKYVDARDTRTIFDLFFGGKPPNMATEAAHHALIDAYEQAVGVCLCHAELRALRQKKVEPELIAS